MQSESPADARGIVSFVGHPDETVERLPEVWYRMNDLPHSTESWVGILQSVLSLQGADPRAAFTPEDLGRIRSPVLLIRGSEDPFGSVEKGRAGAEHFRNAELHEVGIGHLPRLEESERCGGVVREFLDRDG